MTGDEALAVVLANLLSGVHLPIPSRARTDLWRRGDVMVTAEELAIPTAKGMREMERLRDPVREELSRRLEYPLTEEERERVDRALEGFRR